MLIDNFHELKQLTMSFGLLFLMILEHKILNPILHSDSKITTRDICKTCLRCFYWDEVSNVRVSHIDIGDTELLRAALSTSIVTHIPYYHNISFHPKTFRLFAKMCAHFIEHFFYSN